MSIFFLAVPPSWAQGGFMSRQFRIAFEESIIQKNGFLGILRAADVIEFDQPASLVEKDK
jgi:hypothetical protein